MSIYNNETVPRAGPYSEGGAEFGNTPKHELTHLLYTLIHVAESMNVPTGGRQHDLFLGRENKYFRIFKNVLLNN